jgi:alpha-beta hydrolase superfamily lysophospholipase
MSGGDGLVAAAQAGRELRYGGSPPSKELAERMLEVPTQLLRATAERNEAVGALDVEAGLDRVRHEWLRHRDLTIHLETHPSGTADAPTVVVAHGLGDHARRQAPIALALARRGYDAIVVDRQGHGLSEGRRGDAPLEADLGLLEAVIALARSRTAGPVALLGDSLGGIMSWYLLTREPDVDAVVCHCIRHPEVDLDPAFRVKAPLMRVLGRIAPYARIPVRRIADYRHVSLDPLTRDYFDREVDKLFNFTVTARSATSYLGFRPQIPWEWVETPALVTIGGADRMVSPQFTRRSLEAARPPRADYLEIEGAGHQLFLDDLGLAIDPIAAWLERALQREPAAAEAG